MKLADFIQTSPGFKYSINIKYDLNNPDKIKNYIPLNENIDLVAAVIESGYSTNSERSRLLIGSYGTGKSHLSTVMLSILSKNFPEETYHNLICKLENGTPEIARKVVNELQAPKYLPVIISGNGNEIDQILLTGLVNALDEVGLADLMPSTVFYAALNQIAEWEKHYPSAFNAFTELLVKEQAKVESLQKSLVACSLDGYEQFVRLYAKVTHGAKFQPLLLGSPEDIYTAVARSLPQDYKGIIVLFDEFGTYLESKMGQTNLLSLNKLQDFAEACNSSGDACIQLLLITHQPIAQYAAKYGQDMVNTWAKIEGRFKSVRIVNKNSQVYELISKVILKDQNAWDVILPKYQILLTQLSEVIIKTRLFSDVDRGYFEDQILKGCFPLHPVTVYCLPIFSEMVAQNERTIFTFLSTKDFNSLGYFLINTNVHDESLLTLDMIYDYFYEQMQAQESGGRIHDLWLQSTSALARLADDEVHEAMILKAVTVIRGINRLSVLPPSEAMLNLAFTGSSMSSVEFGKAIRNLINKRLLFEGLSSGHLEIIQPGELDIEAEVNKLIAKRANVFHLQIFLNSSFQRSPVLAKRYNDEYAMTRFFACEYISAEEVFRGAAIAKIADDIYSDGKIFNVICASEMEKGQVIDALHNQGQEHANKRAVFIVSNSSPELISNLEHHLRLHDALQMLLDQVDQIENGTDRHEILLKINEHDQIIASLLNRLYSWETVTTFYCGKEVAVNNVTQLTRFISEICNNVYPDAPKLNNEMINKHILTRPILLARQKVVDGLLKPIILPKLGIQGTGPEISIYRTLLVGKGIFTVSEDGNQASLVDMASYQDDDGLKRCLYDLNKLVADAGDGVTFKAIISQMASPPYGIREGVMPIILSILLHSLRNEVSFIDNSGAELPLIAQTVEAGFAKPDQVKLLRQDWSEEKAAFCNTLKNIWYGHAVQDVTLAGPTKEAADTLRRWFMALPRFTRDTSNVSAEAQALRRALKRANLPSSKLLFDEIPKVFGQTNTTGDTLATISTSLRRVKEELDNHLQETLYYLGLELTKLVPIGNRGSLKNALYTWYSMLDEKQYVHIHSDDTQKVMNITQSFKGENELLFVKEICTALIDLRPEDWNDSTVRCLPRVFEDVLQEVMTSTGSVNEIASTNEVNVSFKDSNGQEVNRTFLRNQVSQTGELLQNLMKSYMDEFGQAITKNEKRQILLNLLETITK